MVLIKFLILFTFLANILATKDCGISKRKLPGNNLIHSDFLSNKDDWPWHTAILYHENGNKDNAKYICSGILIKDKFVLTAADCLWDSNQNTTILPKNLFVQLSQLQIIQSSRRRVFNIVVHEDYVPTGFENGPTNNVALLEIVIGSVPLRNEIVPACIPKFEFEDLRGGIMTGWSLGMDRNVKGSLKEVYLPAVDILKCLHSNRDDFAKFFNRETICAGYDTGANSCNVDLGNGYYVQQSNGKWFAVGIVTFKKNFADRKMNLMCDDNFTVFSEIKLYKNWINSVAKSPLENAEINPNLKPEEEKSDEKTTQNTTQKPKLQEKPKQITDKPPQNKWSTTVNSASVETTTKDDNIHFPDIDIRKAEN